MKIFLTAITIAAMACGATAVHAQAADPKTELAKKVVALQQGPELDRLVNQLAGTTAQELIVKWAPKMEENVPKAKQPKASEELNAELKKYVDDASKLISKQVSKVSAESLVPAYSERFTQEELQQLAAFFESPAVKKYQATAPDLGNVFVQKLVEATRADVLARAKQFDDVALKIIGTGPAPGAGKPPAKK
jgi:uncharacterized protein